MNRLIHLLLSLFIVIFSIAIYSNTLKNGFVYDDNEIIVKNALIKNLDNLPKLLDKNYFDLSGEMSYRPFVTFTYFIDYKLYGLKQWGFHLTNVLLHAINGVILYVFIVLITRGTSAINLTSKVKPLLLSLLFIAHPVLTEAVNGISFREDLLAFLFYMTALNLYLMLRTSQIFCSKFKILIIYFLSCLTYSLALLSKEMSATLPMIAYCYESVYSNKKEKYSTHLNRCILGYAVITLAYIYLRFYYFQNVKETYFTAWSPFERFCSISWLLFNYLKLSLFPVSLSADYVIEPVRSLLSTLFILPFILLILLATIAFLIKENERLSTFGILFFITTLIPVFNIVPIANPLAERYLYLPIVGFIVAAGSIFYRILKALTSKYKTRGIHLMMSIIILSIFCIGVVKRNEIWRNDDTLWTATVKKIPNSDRAHQNLGLAYLNLNRFDEAKHELETAIRLNPSDSISHNNMGRVYYKKGLIKEAMQEFNISLSLNRNNPDSYNMRGIINIEQGDFEKGILQFQIALRLKPSDADILTNLGIAYYRTKQFDKAIQQYQNAIKLVPEQITAHYNLGNVYLTKGLKDKAQEEFEITLRLQADYLPARQALESLK